MTLNCGNKMSLLTASSTFKKIPKTGKNTASKQNKTKQNKKCESCSGES
jgi:hypothetical protein